MEYLLKSSVCMAGFYALYFLAFRHLTFHSLNRFYLLASLGLSLYIPSIVFEKKEVVVMEPIVQEKQQEVQNFNTETADNQVFVENKATEKLLIKIDFVEVFTTAYWLITALLLLQFLWNLLRILSKIKVAETLIFENRKLKIIKSAQHFSNASFFNYIFIDDTHLDSTEKKLLIAHESYHYEQLHTLDLMIIQVLKSVFWLNPIVYFYQKSLKQTHEYEVDWLMATNYEMKPYAQLLLKLNHSSKSLIINQFSTQPLSDRIKFLLKKPTKNMKKLLYLLTIPMVAIGVMSFSQTETKTVYNQINEQKIIDEYEVKEYPLKIYDERNRASWTNEFKGQEIFRYTPFNRTLNFIQTKNYNGFHYIVNPISLNIKVIEQVNAFIKKRFLEIVVTEKQTDLKGNLEKIGLAIKHLRTGEMTNPEIFDMELLRREGKDGAYLFFEAYDRNFKESQITYNFGNQNIDVSKSSLTAERHHKFVLANQVARVVHSRDAIECWIYPNRMSMQTFQEVATYLAKYGFNFKAEEISKNQYKVNLENESITFFSKDLERLIRRKVDKKGKGMRLDDVLVLQMNLDSKRAVMKIDSRWSKGLNNSAWEILKVASNKDDAFSFPLDPNLKIANLDSFKITYQNRQLIENQDFIVKNGRIFFDKDYKPVKIHFYTTSTKLFYENLAKLDVVAKPSLPNFWASANPALLPRTLKLPALVSNPIKTDSLRTVLSTNYFGKNPLVIINGEEYPASILHRINPKSFGWSLIYKPNDERAISKYGEKAKDGFIEIRTIDDFLYKTEKSYQTAVENIRRQLNAPKEPFVKIPLLNEDGTEFYQIVLDKMQSNVVFRADIVKDAKIIYLIDNKEVKEDFVKNYRGKFKGVATSKVDDRTIEKFGDKVRGYDLVYTLTTPK